jgi:histone H3/H4
MFDAFASDSEQEAESPVVESKKDVTQDEEDESTGVAQAEAEEEEEEEQEDEEESQEEQEENEDEEMGVDDEEQEEEEEEEKPKPSNEPKAKLTSRVKELRRRRTRTALTADPSRAFRLRPVRRLMMTRVGTVTTTSRSGNRVRVVQAVPRVNEVAARLMAHYLFDRAGQIMKTAYVLARHGKRKMVTTKDVLQAIEREDDIKIAP